jgi:hypothetical protein
VASPSRLRVKSVSRRMTRDAPRLKQTYTILLDDHPRL